MQFNLLFSIFHCLRREWFAWTKQVVASKNCWRCVFRVFCWTVRRVRKTFWRHSTANRSDTFPNGNQNVWTILYINIIWRHAVSFFSLRKKVHSYEYGQRSAAQHDEGGSRATRLVGYDNKEREVFASLLWVWTTVCCATRRRWESCD